MIWETRSVCNSSSAAAAILLQEALTQLLDAEKLSV